MIDPHQMRSTVLGRPVYIYEDLREDHGALVARAMRIRVPRRRHS